MSKERERQRVRVKRWINEVRERGGRVNGERESVGRERGEECEWGRDRGRCVSRGKRGEV